MRTKNMLKNLDEIALLCKYLYMSEDHFITINNGMADIQIRMAENGHFFSKNMNFPDLPDLRSSCDMTVPNMLGIIAYLKKQKPVLLEDVFENRWEEISETTKANLALNRV